MESQFEVPVMRLILVIGAVITGLWYLWPDPTRDMCHQMAEDMTRSMYPVCHDTAKIVDELTTTCVDYVNASPLGHSRAF